MSNKEGIGSNIISVPKGGGAVSGMGEKFSPDLFTGTGNFSVPVSLPAGRNGFQPQITLGYSTGNGNSEFGLGWGMSIPGVSRKTSKGIPLYKDRTKDINQGDVFILSGAEDLVPVPGAPENAQRYRPRTEGLFARIDRYLDKENDYWKVKSKDGLTSWYGTPASRNPDSKTLKDHCTCVNPDYKTHVFEWRLSRTEDVFGNHIDYLYERDSIRKDGGHNWDKLYLKEIQYGHYNDNSQEKPMFIVRFNYENRPDPYSSYSAGFEIRTVRRCKNIQVYHNLTSGELLTKTYHLVYLDERVANKELPEKFLPVNRASLLSQVKIEGHDEGTSEWMPPLEFSYTGFEPSRKNFFPLTGRELPGFGLSNGDFELVDLFGKGLPDMVQISGGQGTVNVARYWENLGNGEFARPREMKETPGGFSLSDPEVTFMDSNGDGKADLVVNKKGLNGYFPLKEHGQWDRRSFRSYKYAPSFSFNDPEVKLLDLDGDGITDVLKNSAAFECYFNDPDLGFYKKASVDKKQLKEFPNISFADPRVRTGGLSGSGLQDLVLIADGRVDYWPNLGHGKWGSRISMKNSPRLPFNADLNRLYLSDVDGDGLSDLIYIENNSVTLWINQSGNSWSAPITIKGTPPVWNTSSIRITDILGTGVAGILWSYDYDGQKKDRFFYLDFTGGLKPYLLNEMDNNMGALTRVHYKSSAAFYVEDRRKRKPWKTSLPFPVMVVEKVEVLDQLSKGKLTTAYSYHHGYYDGGEREFRGFGKVVQRDTESFERFNATGLHRKTLFSSEYTEKTPGEFNKVSNEYYQAPLETRNWFHLGAVGEEFGDWKERYFEDEYWQEDKQLLQRPAEMISEISSLPRRAQRDAYRALRGSVLRLEVYVLDGNPRSNRPYSVSENLQGVRLEFAPGKGISQATDKNPEANNKAGSGYIFFAHGLASRSSQWERGEEPMTSVSFTEEYDAYGTPAVQIGMALPRSMKPPYKAGISGDPVLCTLAVTEVVNKDEATHYLIGRPVASRSYEVLNTGEQGIYELRTKILEDLKEPLSTISYKLLNHSLTYYDGAAFTGLPHGQLGDYGIPVRSETLAFTEEQLNTIYGADRPPYLTTGAAPAWTADYPNDFKNQLPSNAGYFYKNPIQAGQQHYYEGYYVESDRKKFDFHENPLTAHGLVKEMQDSLGNTASVDYDSYKLLPVKVTDPAGMETIADYDYRVMQAGKITDPNQNRTEFAFSPLGFLTKSAVMGKEGELVGDTLEVPGSRMQYDFFAFINTKQPVYVKTIQREHHHYDNVNDDTLVTVEYSDGFGRLLQTRTQAEEVLFGDQTFGDSGLPAALNENAPAIGTENTDPNNPNVIVSGWQVYNNKGWVVEKYEPYYDKGFDYVQTAEGKGQKARMYYDPRGQVIRTVNPDGTEQRVVFGVPLSLASPNIYTPTPWESYSYDANDLAEITHPSDGTVPVEHHYTPSSSKIDALGRTIETTDRNYKDGNIENVIMRYSYDIQGNLLKVSDPVRNSTEPSRAYTFEHSYDLLKRPLKTIHIDGGRKINFPDALNRPVELRDAKGALVLTGYDNLSRPVNIWARDISGETVTLRQKFIYGDNAGLTNPESNNLKGKLYRHYDEAGLTKIDNYDFKGNVPEKVRQLISDATILNTFSSGNWSQISPFVTDWSVLTDNDLDPIEYVSSMEYDGINRVTKMTYPEDTDNQRKIILPHYNRAGSLDKLELKATEASTPQTYVERIAYNAKGQRLLLALGNGLMTRYNYDPQTFRLHRVKTEKYDNSVNNLEYQPNGGNLQNQSYEYDLSGNIIKTTDQTTGAGIPNSPDGLDKLIRQFTYDPLYRLQSATGRETNTVAKKPWEDTHRSSDPNASRQYTQHYSYDKLGNILKLQHVAADNNFTRIFNPDSGGNPPAFYQNQNLLNEIKIGDNTYDFTYDANGNTISEGLSRHFSWNYGDKLRTFHVQVNTEEPSVYAHYLYDAGGNRVKKLVRKQGGGYKSTAYIDGTYEHTRESSYSAPSQTIPSLVIGSWTIGGGLSTGEQCLLHIMDGQSRIATIRTGDTLGDTTPAIKYNVEDHLGSSTILTDSTGSLVNKEEYYPFGETSFGSYGKKRYRYNGKEKDEESGLYNYGMRYYNAWTCRFLSVDPLAAKYKQLTPYQYASNDPINQIDVDGLEGDKAEASGDNSNSDGGTIAAETSDNTNQAGPMVTQELLNSVNNGASNENSTTSEKRDFSNITIVEPTRKDNTSQVETQNAELKTGAAINSQKIAEAKTNESIEKKINEAPSVSAKQTQSDELIDLNRRQQTWRKNVIENPNSIFNPTNYYRTEMRLARAGGQGIVMGAEAVAAEFALGKVIDLYRGWRYGSTLNPKDIHFMQSSAKNITGEYTVLENAEALKSGALNPKVLKFNVWRDVNGKVWTLDHRRLAAFRLSGLEKAPVRWASNWEVRSNFWKMSTTNSGVSIKLKLGNGKSINVK